MMKISPREIIEFWYSDKMTQYWFNSTPEIDHLILTSYESVWVSARDGKLDIWCDTAEGCLALVIILDQFPLNMYRGQAVSFSTEARAVDISLYAIDENFDQQLAKNQLAFLYMPLMHSENLKHQQLSVNLFDKAGLVENAKFARHHYDIISRFGRFPHRNHILGRKTTPEEMDYLESGQAFLG